MLKSVFDGGLRSAVVSGGVGWRKEKKLVGKGGGVFE